MKESRILTLPLVFDIRETGPLFQAIIFLFSKRRTGQFRPAQVEFSPIIADRKMVAEPTTNVPSATGRHYLQSNEVLANEEQSRNTK